MFRKLSSRLTFSNAIACIALFVSLGATSYAAVVITGKQIKDNTVATKDIRNNSVRSKDVRNGSLLAKDFKRGQIRSAGARGPQGPRGPQGVQGLRGAPGISAIGISANEVDTPAGAQEGNSTLVTCPEGTMAVGAGASLDGSGQKDVNINEVAVRSDLRSVRVTAFEEGSGTPEPWSLKGTATCAKVGS